MPTVRVDRRHQEAQLFSQTREGCPKDLERVWETRGRRKVEQAGGQPVCAELSRADRNRLSIFL